MESPSIFYNGFGRLRSCWRFAVFLGAFIVTAGILGISAAAILSQLPFGYGPGSTMFLVANGVVSFIPAIVVGWLCGKFFEDLPFRAIGAAFTKGWLKHLVLGLLIGSVTLSLAAFIGIAFGGLGFEYDAGFEINTIIRTLLSSLAVFAAAAAFEEAFFRGYMLQTFSRAGLAWLAIALTSIFFGAVHLGNPDAGIISTLNTALAGIWFGLAYLKTRDLWFPFGMHLMWNWMQGAFFGIEVSGLTDITTAPLLKEIDRGPAWLTGETYGIEGGIACTIAIIVSIITIHYLPFLKADEEMLALTSSESPA